MAEVFYRKWRPQGFAEVVGQEATTRTLLNALETGRIAHAYLFCGPRGTGKTSTGRVLAKAINCLTNGKGEPCNECDMCRSITESRCLDVVEIDAASNRSIDDIRGLREQVGFVPGRAKYKVYIIDEVHMLTEAASNALLKTLEEPPHHVVFILATTEPHKVLATILSRCQRYDFRRLSHKAISERLAYICQKEAVKIDPGSLGWITRNVSGSLRDAENLLEQMVVSFGDRIELKQVQDALGGAAVWQARKLVEQVFARDARGGLATLNKLVAEGIDLAQFSRHLMGYLRAMLIVKTGAELAADLSIDEVSEIQDLVKKIPVVEILKVIKLFAQIGRDFENDNVLPFELALIEYALPDLDKAEQALSKPASAPAGEEKPAAQASAAAPVNPPAVRPAPAPAGTVPEPVPAEAAKVEAPSAAAPTAAAPAASAGQASSLEHIAAHWNEFVESLRGVGSGGTLQALVRGCLPDSIEGDVLVLKASSTFHREKIEDKKYRHMIEKRLKDEFGSPSQVKCILVQVEKKTKPKPTDSPLVKAAIQMGARVVNTEEK